MKSYQNLLSHWQKYQPFSGLHPDDKIDSCECVKYNLNEYSNSNDYFNDKSKFHINLMPVPYIGDLLNSSVYFLLLNPGFSPQDYHDESNEHFHKAQVASLKQEKLNNPLYPLDPSLCWASTAQWSHKKLKLLINTFAEKNKLSYLEATKALSQKISYIELFPYHSKKFKSKKDFLNIKSTLLIKEFVKERSQNSNAFFFVMRQKNTWNLPEQKNIITFTPGEVRGAHISEKYVDIIMKHL